MPSLDAVPPTRSAERHWFDRPLPGAVETTLSLAARALGFPTVRINIVHQDLQHTIGFFGVGDLCPIDREESFCDVVVATGEWMAVPDATIDPRFSGLASVVSGEIGAYLGVPLRGPDGGIVGALCVIDPIGRVLTAQDTWRLQQFVPIIEDQLDRMWQLDAQERHPASDPAGPGAVVPWFRPVAGMSDHRVLGYDAVARRVGPDGGVTDPRRPLVGRPAELLELDLAVAAAGMAAVRGWQRHDPRLKVNVNLTAAVIARPDCLTLLAELAARAGIKPIAVNITLKEAPAWSVTDSAALATLKGLRDIGFGIFRGEFGTVWAGLDQLLWFPCDAVRLDPALTAALGTDVGDTMIRAVTSMAHALEQRVVIDRIDTLDQARAAAALGCDRALGAVWGDARPPAAVDERYRATPVGAAPQGVR